MNSVGILHKRVPVRKRFFRKLFSGPLFKANKRTYQRASITGFVHAGTLARHILDELRARAENASAEQKLSSAKGVNDDA